MAEKTKAMVEKMLNETTSELNGIDVEIIKLTERQRQLSVKRGDLQDIRDTLKGESQ